MDNINEKITAVSLNFVCETYHIKQSGILIQNRILTTGGLLLPYIFDNKVKDIKDFDIKISLEKRGRVLLYSGSVVQVFPSRDLNNSLIKYDLGLDPLSIKSFSHFLVIEINDSDNAKFTKIEISFNQNQLYQGQDVLTVSTPFGHNMFLNCYSKGIISKIVDSALFVTDSRLSSGCEGGPIYKLDGPIKLIGLVLSQFKIYNEYTGFNLCCHFYKIYEAYCQFKHLPIIPSNFASKTEEHPIHRVSNSVLPIKTPSRRGSCISLNGKGLLVTCSHVINYDSRTPVEVIFCEKSYAAKVLSCSTEDDILDLAFLQINVDTQLPTCVIYNLSPIKGEAVYIVGYKYFWDNILQLVSKGTVLKHEERGPVYTSCNTHSGNSGGGLFEKDGKLVAIVCGILFEKQINTPHHCHNVGIPMKLLKKPIDAYIQTGDLSHLVNLCQTKDLYLLSWHLFTKSKL